jgi:hypothetical protein
VTAKNRLARGHHPWSHPRFSRLAVYQFDPVGDFRRIRIAEAAAFAAARQQIIGNFPLVRHGTNSDIQR